MAYQEMQVDRIEQFSLLVEEFLSLGEKVISAADVAPSSLEGWQGLQKRFTAFKSQGKPPVLVATLYGPTGAGKSTVFKLLTGIDVPAGGSIRPCSMACAAALPKSLDHSPALPLLFPGYHCRKMENPGDLRQADSHDQLLYATHQLPSETMQLALVDVPDFNAVEKSNWDKAHLMLERAEIVFFLVYPNAYADDRVVEELIRCCKKAAHLAYLITMVPPEAADPISEARIIWEDLLKKASRINAFQTKRADGKTLHDFLSASRVFFSPRSPSPILEEIQSLEPGHCSLPSLLTGLEGEKILLRGLSEQALQAGQSMEGLLGSLRLGLEKIKERDQSTREEIMEWARSIAHHEFPAGRLIQITVEEAKRRRGTFLRWISKPFELLSFGGEKIRALADWIKGNRTDVPRLKERETLERGRLHEAVLAMPQRWRGAWPDLAGDEGILSASRCDASRREFEKKAPPLPGHDWEDQARIDLESWAKENKTKSWFLASIPEVLISASTAVLVVDLFITGGAFTTIALASGVAGVSGLGLKFFEENNLLSVARAAQDRWKTQRSEELDSFLNSSWADKLLQGVRGKRALLESLPRDKLAGLAEKLKSLAKDEGAV